MVTFSMMISCRLGRKALFLSAFASLSLPTSLRPSLRPSLPPFHVCRTRLEGLSAHAWCAVSSWDSKPCGGLRTAKDSSNAAGFPLAWCFMVEGISILLCDFETTNAQAECGGVYWAVHWMLWRQPESGQQSDTATKEQLESLGMDDSNNMFIFSLAPPQTNHELDCGGNSERIVSRRCFRTPLSRGCFVWGWFLCGCFQKLVKGPTPQTGWVSSATWRPENLGSGTCLGSVTSSLPSVGSWTGCKRRTGGCFHVASLSWAEGTHRAEVFRFASQSWQGESRVSVTPKRSGETNLMCPLHLLALQLEHSKQYGNLEILLP